MSVKVEFVEDVDFVYKNILTPKKRGRPRKIKKGDKILIDFQYCDRPESF